MSKKTVAQSGQGGWRYSCDCGYETLNIGEAVGHINKFREHHLKRIEL